MPRPTTPESGSTALGLTEDVTGLDIDGVDAVAQGKSKYANVVIDFTKVPRQLITAGTECEIEIKQARPGATNAGFPKASIMYVVNGGDFDGEAFWDDLLFIPPQPPKKGTMWRVHQFCEAIDYELPTTIAADEIIGFMKQFCEDILGETLNAEIDINVSTQVNPKTSEVYEPRNAIKKFIKLGSRSIDDLLLG